MRSVYRDEFRICGILVHSRHGSNRRKLNHLNMLKSFEIRLSLYKEVIKKLKGDLHSYNSTFLAVADDMRPKAWTS